jgi:hypothetical protein
MSDTVTALQKALAPKTGMQRIPFTTESYRHDSLPLSSKLLMNLMAEAAPADARTPVVLIPTAGLGVALPFALGDGPVRALNTEYPGFIYAVSGSRFYRVTVVGGGVVVQDLGDVGIPTGPYNFTLMVTIAVSTIAVVVVVPPNAFTCAHGDLAVNQIGGTFPEGGAGSVTFFQGYFVFNNATAGTTFFISRLEDPNDYDALDFASLEAFSTDLVLTKRIGANLWFIGRGGMEIWYNAGSSGLETSPGTSFFPFRRMAGGILEHGTEAPRSVAVADDSLFWVGFDGIVYRTVGYRAKRVSTHAIERIIRDNGVDQVMVSMSWAYQGHYYYAVTWASETLVYDIATDKWHNRSSNADGSGRWRPDCAAPGQAVPIFGDSLSGNLLSPVENLSTDMSVPLKRQVITPPLWANTVRAFCSRVELEMECGGTFSPGDITLEWSDDGGRNWTGGPRVMNSGRSDETRKRVYTTRLGSFRQRMFRITAAGWTTLYALDAEITPGAT